MAQIGKALQIAHQSECSLGRMTNFAVSPYEKQTHFIGSHNPANPLGYSWETIASSRYGFLGSPPEGVVAVGYSREYGDIRPDLRLLSAKGSSLGWTFVHESRAKSASYEPFKGGRSIRTVIREARDGGDGEWRCYSGGHVASSIILPEGVNSRLGIKGENVLTIQSATPDAFLGNLSLPSLPYVLAAPANKERYKWWFLATYGYDYENPPNPLPTTATRRASVQNTLGYPLQGAGQGGIADGIGIDPFSGFAYYRDQDTTKIGELMEPAPTNDLHFFNNLSTSRVVVEVLTNHVTESGKPLGETFQMEILTGLDLENDVLHFEASGSINSIINEAAQHGVWRTWWDSRCGFHFIPDYYANVANDQTNTKRACTLQSGPSLIGEIEVNLNDTVPLVHSYRVRGQPFTSFGDADTDPMSNYFNDKTLGSIYPTNAKAYDSPGGDPVMDNYIGKRADVQAYRLFRKGNARTTFTWKNFPYPSLAFGLLHRAILLKVQDPKGGWNFSGGKLFVVENVSIDWRDNGQGGGVYLCSVSGIEI